MLNILLNILTFILIIFFYSIFVKILFLTNGAVNKDIKSKRKFCRLYDVLTNFLHTASERLSDIIYKHGIYMLSYELPNHLRLTILGN